MTKTEKELRELWTRQGISEQRQDELVASVTAKAQPGTPVGPFTIGGRGPHKKGNQ